MVRTMAVSSITPLPKSQPDYSKLNTFTGYVVTVTKHLQARGTVGQVVVATQKMSKDNLLALQAQLPLTHGSGFYAFTAADEGGTGEDTWLVKLGSETPQQESFMAGPNGVTPGGFSGAPQALGEGVIHLGHNFFYNEAMGTLTTPWRTIVSWKQGDPMPNPPMAQTAATFTPPAPNTPWGQPQMGGWGGYPIQSEDTGRLKQLEQQLTEERQRRREDDMRTEQARRDAEVRQMIADSNSRFEKLIEKLATKPQGDDPALAAIKQQNEMLQRRLDDEKRERDSERRDAQTREEIRRNKEDTDRMLQALTANKSDPMLTMVMQAMQSSNASAMEAVKAIQSSTSTANTSAERQVQALVEQLRSTIMSPIQIMEMMRSSRGDGADMAKTMIETMKESSNMQREVYGQLLDVASQGGNPPWVTAIESIMNKVGPIGEAIAARANQPKVVVREVVRPPAAAQPAAGAVAGAVAGAPVQGQVQPQAAPAVEPATGKGKKHKKGGRTKAGSSKTPSSKLPQGKGPDGKFTVEQIRAMDPDVLGDLMDKFSDNVFFGDILGPGVVQLRKQAEAGTSAEKLGIYLIEQRGALIAIDPMPMAVELFMAEQIDVLVARLLPEVTDAYHEEVVKTIEAKLDEENAGRGEE
jgi:hypothetical protein